MVVSCWGSIHQDASQGTFSLCWPFVASLLGCYIDTALCLAAVLLLLLRCNAAARSRTTLSWAAALCCSRGLLPQAARCALRAVGCSLALLLLLPV